MNIQTKPKEIKGRFEFKKEAFPTQPKPSLTKPKKPAQDHKKQKGSLLTRLWTGIKKFFEPLRNWCTEKKTKNPVHKNPVQDSVPYEDFNPTAQDVIAHKLESKLLNASKHMSYAQSKNPRKQSIKNRHHRESTATHPKKDVISKKALQQKHHTNKPISKNTEITVQKSSSSQYSKNRGK